MVFSFLWFFPHYLIPRCFCPQLESLTNISRSTESPQCYPCLRAVREKRGNERKKWEKKEHAKTISTIINSRYSTIHCTRHKFTTLSLLSSCGKREEREEKREKKVEKKTKTISTYVHPCYFRFFISSTYRTHSHVQTSILYTESTYISSHFHSVHCNTRNHLPL